MFTSRAEYRLILREDNADLRLTEQGRKLGLIDDARWEAFTSKREAIEIEKQRLKDTWVQPKTPIGDKVNELLERPMSREYSLMDLLKRPDVKFKDLQNLHGDNPLVQDVAEQVQISAKYDGYIKRQQEEIDLLRRQENMPLPEDFEFDGISGLSNEVKQKLKDIRPATLAQASRISGVTPAAVSLLLIQLKKYQAGKAKTGVA